MTTSTTPRQSPTPIKAEKGNIITIADPDVTSETEGVFIGYDNVVVTKYGSVFHLKYVCSVWGGILGYDATPLYNEQFAMTGLRLWEQHLLEESLRLDQEKLIASSFLSNHDGHITKEEEKNVVYRALRSYEAKLQPDIDKVRGLRKIVDTVINRLLDHALQQDHNPLVADMESNHE